MKYAVTGECCGTAWKCWVPWYDTCRSQEIFFEEHNYEDMSLFELLNKNAKTLKAEIWQPRCNFVTAWSIYRTKYVLETGWS